MRNKLLVTGILMIFIMGQAAVYAADSGQTSSVITDQSTNKTIHYTYNAYGVMTSSVENATITTTTTNEEGQASTTVQKSTTVSEWIGGSVKPVSSTGTIETKNAAGTVTDKGTFNTNYSYDSTTGALVGASGGGENWSYNTETGKLASHTTSTDTYQIIDGQALRVKSTYSGTGYADDGSTANSSISGSTTYNYEVIAGSHVLKSETSTQTTTMTSGEYTGSVITQTTTKGYTRNSNGQLTGLTLSGSGSNESHVNGGSKTYTKKLSDYTVKLDPEQGYYISDQWWTEWN
ncbi:MAG: hypothetical protein PHT59_04110 [Candidatus Omnitrophica bacterium]|nr:hypothetical protein [Candidatus Omnitrophota bacterium]